MDGFINAKLSMSKRLITNVTAMLIIVIGVNL